VGGRIVAEYDTLS
jgi:hypothetical protein